MSPEERAGAWTSSSPEIASWISLREPEKAEGLERNRYYDPWTGMYLQPEAMMQDAVWVGRTAMGGHGPSAYAYAESNPIYFTDPTGKFIRNGRCENWDKALVEARRLAGCDDGRTNLTCACQRKLEQCAACDVCMYLNDFSGPWTNFPEWIVRQDGRQGSAFGATHWDDSATSVQNVDMLSDLCIGEGNVMPLASVMIHEATHICGDMTGSGPIITDDAGDCSARSITRACFHGR